MTAPSLGPSPFQGPHGHVEAWLARPAGRGPFPGVLVLQEGLGVTGHLQGLAKRYAEAGYLALVPNLYSHEPAHRELPEPDVIRGIPIARARDRAPLLAALDAEQRARIERVLSWFDARDPSTYFPDTQLALEHLARQPELAPGKLVSVGFSMGGGLSAKLAASGAPLAGAVVYYGEGPSGDLALLRHMPLLRPTMHRLVRRVLLPRYFSTAAVRATPHKSAPRRPRDAACDAVVLARLTAPLLGHYADDDPAITPEVPGLYERLKGLGKPFTAHVYPGTQHGFFSESRPTYQRAAAELSHARTLAFFSRVLAS
jgi:carboxymethylenebutenolidase